MKRLIVLTLIAASLLVGCGSNFSQNNNAEYDAGSKQSESAGEYKVTYGLPIKIEMLKDANRLEEQRPDSSDDISGMIDDSIVPDKEHNISKRVVCWGDSLTIGTGGFEVTYPDVLAEISGATVCNYGVFNDRASTIAARQGANPQHVQDITRIPADTTPVSLNIVGDNGEWEPWGDRGFAGINPCVIAGVEGTLSIEEGDGSVKRYFSRNEPGEVVNVSASEPFYTHAMMDKRKGDILVIWSGSSDGWFDDRSIDTIINYQRSMLEYAECDEYVIIGYTAYPNIGDAIDEWNDRLADEYGEHYLDVRSYLLNYGLERAGIEPKDTDIEDINNGQIPGALRYDESHGNADFYRIVGELVYNKLYNLGYLK